PSGMEELNLFWEKIKEETDLEIQLSIREEYIRYIYEILSFVKDTGKITDIPQSVVALEILNLFFNE
ncbi:MAG: hypothetical protein IKW74_03020, partial [Thermoguttaceae bacterium]|nr:hypothetical protein [Thermoguttaceae bacterium]